MKKSVMSITVLVVLISVVAMFLGGSVANARTAPKFIYNKAENVETVYTLDKTGKYLTPKLKYELQKNEDGALESKTAYRWNADKNEWTPYYIMVFTQEKNNSVVEYAIWNKETGEYSLNQQKAIYNKGAGDDVVTYTSYNWNQTVGDWDLNNQVVLQNYLAIHIPLN